MHDSAPPSGTAPGSRAGPGGDTGRFTADAARRALAEICAALGLDDRDAQPLKLTLNLVFRLPREGAVVRIATSAAMTHRIRKVVRVARWLARHDFPAVRLFPDLPAPVTAAGYTATVWVDARGGTRDPTTGDLAAILRRLHRLPGPEPPLPAWDPLDDVRRRLAAAQMLAADERAFLEDLTARVEAGLRSVRYVLPRTVIHGDAHLGNLISTADGQVVICDFDATCLGPAEWDLVPVAVGTIRFGRPQHLHTELARDYGFDVTAWDGFPVLRAVRELKLVTSVVPILAGNPSAAAQFRVRLNTLRSGRQDIPWSPYR